MSVLCTRRQISVVYGLGVWMEFSTTRRQSTIHDLSIRDGKTGLGNYDVGAKFIYPIMYQQLCCFVVRCPDDQIWSCFTPGNDAFGALVTRWFLRRVHVS